MAGPSDSGSSRFPMTCCRYNKGPYIPPCTAWNRWIRAEWGDSENHRRARFYSLTRSGQKRLGQELAQWERLSSAIGLVVKEV